MKNGPGGAAISVPFFGGCRGPGPDPGRTRTHSSRGSAASTRSRDQPPRGCPRAAGPLAPILPQVDWLLPPRGGGFGLARRAPAILLPIYDTILPPCAVAPR